MESKNVSVKTEPSLVLISTVAPYFYRTDSGSPKDIHSALGLLQSKNIPLVFFGYQTSSEIKEIQKKWGIRQPFICENGGAVFFPKRQFPGLESATVVKGNWEMISLGKPYRETIQMLKQLQAKKHGPMRFFSEMSFQEVAERTGLPPEEAKLAKRREYSELIVLDEPGWSIRKYLKEVSKNSTYFIFKEGFYFFFAEKDESAMGIRMMIDLFRYVNPNVKFAAIGITDRDRPLLQSADLPLLLQNQTGKWHPRLQKIPNTHLIDAHSEPAWRKAVEKLIDLKK